MTKEASPKESINSMAERPEKKKSAAEASASFSLEDIKVLFTLMKTNDIGELDLEQKGTKIHIVSTRAMAYQHAPVQAVQPVVQQVSPVGVMAQHPAPVAAVSAPSPAVPVEVAPAAAEVPSNLKTVYSPMVGTFYRSPAPDADPFVQVGDQVKEDTVLCIIEAMKLMNEIKAEQKGRIAKILADNGVPVEYNQPLFLIEPL